jgi:hypothetical protein
MVTVPGNSLPAPTLILENRYVDKSIWWFGSFAWASHHRTQSGDTKAGSGLLRPAKRVLRGLLQGRLLCAGQVLL